MGRYLWRLVFPWDVVANIQNKECEEHKTERQISKQDKLGMKIDEIQADKNKIGKCRATEKREDYRPSLKQCPRPN